MWLVEVIKEYWALIVGAIGAAVWLTRLEAGMLSNRKDIRRIEERQEKESDKLDAKLDRIEGSIQQVIVILGNKEDRK